MSETVILRFTRRCTHLQLPGQITQGMAPGQLSAVPRPAISLDSQKRDKMHRLTWVILAWLLICKSWGQILLYDCDVQHDCIVSVTGKACV